MLSANINYDDPEVVRLADETLAEVRKERRLRDLKVNRVDLVRRGANPESRVTFVKQDPEDKNMSDLEEANEIANKMTATGKANSVPEALLQMSYDSRYKALLRRAMQQMPPPPPTPPVAKVQRNPELARIEKAAQALVDNDEAQTLDDATSAVCQGDPDAYRAYAQSVAGR